MDKKKNWQITSEINFIDPNVFITMWYYTNIHIMYIMIDYESLMSRLMNVKTFENKLKVGLYPIIE